MNWDSHDLVNLLRFLPLPANLTPWVRDLPGGSLSPELGTESSNEATWK